jgi:SAM-dependent methyltransferase
MGFSRALDFGCGVGRLSQALADRFQEVVGVDIAESMVAKAHEFNRHGNRVRYVVHGSDDLSCFADGLFDLVYSVITLQHIPPEAAAAYIGEFFRVLRPGGTAIFQVPCGRRYRPGSLGAWLYRARRQHLRRWWKAVRGRPAVEIHAMAREDVEEIILSSGGRLLDVVSWPDPRKPHRGLRYCATKESPQA